MVNDAAQADAGSAQSSYSRGVLLLVLGAVAFSSAGLFVRLIGRDAPTILFWRGIFTVLAVGLFIVWRERRGTVRNVCDMGWPGLAVAVFQAASMASFISSLQYTTVANNSIIFGAGPFMTAGLAWLMIREQPSAPTLILSGVAMLGALLVVGSSFAVSRASVIGDALAVLMTLTFSIKTVIVRRQGGRSMIPAGVLGALLGSIGAAPFVRDWSISAYELGLFALFGFTQQGAGLILTTLGTAHVPAAHAALLLALDLPLSPAWVWLVIGERPTTLGLIGGLIVLSAILAHIVIEGRRRSQN